MKIKQVKINNLHKFVDFEIEFNKDITKLVGVNGSGKTTVGLISIWACFKGIAEKNKDGQLIGERYRFIGSQKPSADIEILLEDEQKHLKVLIKNHITKQGNHITFKPIEGEIDPLWLDTLFDTVFVSAKHFCALDPRAQAQSLGIDTSTFDADTKMYKSDFTYFNRKLKDMGDIGEEPDNIEHVDVEKLRKQGREISEFNQIQHDRQRDIENTESRIEDLREQKKALHDRIAKGMVILNAKPKPEELKDGSKIDQAFEDAEETNRKADAYNQWMNNKTNQDTINKNLAYNKAKQKEVDAEKIKYIKAFDFGFDGLTVSGNGGLLLNGRPIQDKYFSKGELEIIVAKLHMSMNPDLKVRFIDDFERLDEDNQAKLVNELLEAGFQIITAQVGKKKEDDKTILMRECKVVKKYVKKSKKALI